MNKDSAANWFIALLKLIQKPDPVVIILDAVMQVEHRAVLWVMVLSALPILFNILNVWRLHFREGFLATKSEPTHSFTFWCQRNK